MLFLLRQIRRQLLMKNKVTTYLLYGIGEIILVVVGILIAVQIDDYAQTQKDKQLTKKYVNALIEELKANLVTLEQDIQDSQGRMDTLLVLKQMMSAPSATIDSLISIARYRFDYAYDPDVHLNNITFRTLESTGDIRLLNQDLKDSLYAYQAELIKWSNIIKHNIDYYIEIDIDYHKYYPVSGEAQFLEQRLADRLWGSIDKNEFALRFNAMVSNKIIAFRFVLRYQQYLHWKTEKFLRFLQKNNS